MIDLRPYQVEARDRTLAALKSRGGFYLMCEQRTGKTPPACAVIERLRPERLLVVCPKIAVSDIWATHLQMYRIYQRVGDQRIISWDSLWKERRRLKRWEPDMIIADELHYAKDPHSKRSRAVRQIARYAKWRLGVGGTPQESGLEDYWAQFDFIDPGLFGEWKFFKARYLVYGGFRKKKIIAYRNKDELRRLVASMSFRVLLEDVKKRKTQISTEVIRFDLEESRAMYTQMHKKFILELQDRVVMVKEIGTDGLEHFVRRRKRVAAPRAITQAMKLHQISGGFILDEEGNTHRFGDEKLAHAGALLLHLGRVPTVIFVRFRPELRRLAQLCQLLGRKVTLISGEHRGEYVSGTPFDVAIVQVQSGVSIDLAHAEEAIFYSWNYSYLNYDQAKFRIRSFDSERARYWYLVARRTIDEDLLRTVTHKLKFATLIIDKYRRRQQ